MEIMEITLADNVQGIGAAGDRVSLSLTPADVHDPAELPEYLAGYRPFGYRADEASPLIPVTKDEDKFRTFESNNAFLRVNVKGTTQGAVPEVDPKTRLESYKVIERYIGSFIPRQTQDQTGPTTYDPIMAAGRRCMTAVELDREVDVFTLIGTAGNWAAGQITPATAVWTDVVTGDPILDIQTAVTKSDQPVTAIWLNQNLAFTMLRHPLVRDHMRQFFGDGAVQGIATAVANAGVTGASGDFFIPGLPPFKVSASKVLNEATGLLEYVLPGDVAVLVTVPPGGVPMDGEEIATTYTFRRRGPSGTGIEVRQFTLENRGPKGGTMIVVTVADIPVFTANTAGGIITGAA